MEDQIGHAFDRVECYKHWRIQSWDAFCEIVVSWQEDRTTDFKLIKTALKNVMSTYSIPAWPQPLFMAREEWLSIMKFWKLKQVLKIKNWLHSFSVRLLTTRQVRPAVQDWLYLACIWSYEAVFHCWKSSSLLEKLAHESSVMNVWDQSFLLAQHHEAEVAIFCLVNYYPVGRKVTQMIQPGYHSSSTRCVFWWWICLFLMASTSLNEYHCCAGPRSSSSSETKNLAPTN